MERLKKTGEYECSFKPTMLDEQNGKTILAGEGRVEIISNSGFAHYLQQGMEETGLDIREFLRTDSGKELANRYGYTSQHAIDNLTQKYKDYI